MFAAKKRLEKLVFNLFGSVCLLRSGWEYPVFYILLLLIPAACGSPDTPLDANTRKTIDSITTAQIVIMRKELDSLCQQRRLTEMPHMVDSIKQKRMEEIQNQLKTIPK